MKKCSTGKLKRLLNIRRRDDRVKIIIYLWILAIVFLVAAIRNVCDLAEYVNSAVEYELKGDLKSKMKLKKLRSQDDIYAISLQRNNQISVKYKTKKTSFNCVYLSKQYVKDIYNIDSFGEMPTFYMNKAGFEQLAKELEIVLNDKKKIVLKYMEGDGTYKSAKVILIDGDIFTDEPFAFSIDSNLSLSQNADCVRAYVKKPDIEQSIIKKCENIGYYINNKEDLIIFENNLNTLFLKFKYNALILLICIIWIRCYCKHILKSDTIKPITE